jgi:hypothetical protein
MKLTKATATERPQTLATLTQIGELAVGYRFQDRTPTVSELARVIADASRSLRIRDLDERISCENAAVLALAKNRNLIG